MSEENSSAPVGDASQSTEITEQGQGAAGQENNQAPITPKLTKKLKLKLDGVESEEDLPFEVDENNRDQVEYLRRHLQMSKVAQKRMNEASTTRKQAEQFIQALQNDPMRILSNPKLMGEEKFQKIAEEFLAKKIQQQMLTPEERSQIEKEDRLRNYEEQERQRNEETERTQVQELQKHYQESYTKTITQALESSNLPKNPYTVKRMAQLLQQNIKHGLELEPAHLAQLVKEDYQRELASIIGNSDPSQIIAMFGEETVNKLRKHDLEKLRTSLSPQARFQQQQSGGSVETPKTRSWADFNAELKKKL